MNSPDPFNTLSLDEIKNLPEPEYRLYVVHKLNILERNQKRILKRPEVTRSNVAIFLSAVATLCVVITLMRGGF